MIKAETTMSVSSDNKNCLICNDFVTVASGSFDPLIIIKVEPQECQEEWTSKPAKTQLPPPKPISTSNAGTGNTVPPLPQPDENLEAFFKLLHLSPFVRSRLVSNKMKGCTGNETGDILFCTSCSDIISNTIRLFQQIQGLQYQVEHLICQSYEKHLKTHEEFSGIEICKGNGEEAGSVSRRKHICQPKFCSKVDRFRKQILQDIKKKSTKSHFVSKLNEKQESGSLSLDYQKLATKYHLKESSIALNRITDEDLNLDNATISKVPTHVSIESSSDSIGVYDETGGDGDDGFDWASPEIDEYEEEPKVRIDLLQQQVPILQVSEGLTHPQKTLSVKTVCKPKHKVNGKNGYKKKEGIGKVVSKKTLRTQPVSCPECQEVFRYEFQQKCHMAKCHEIDPEVVFPFSCSRCGKRFYLESKLQLHLDMQGGVCEKNPLNQDCIVVTGKGNKRFKCRLCGFTTSSRNKFEDHAATHTKLKRFTCEACGMCFIRKNDLTRHKLLAHFEGAITEHPFKCAFAGCDKIFGARINLKYHERKHRGEFIECPHPGCGYKALTQGNLKYHSGIHSKERPFSCEHCGNTYKRIDRVKRHILQQHTNPEDRPFKCVECGKTFNEQFRLNRHQITHTKEKPISCELCSKHFAVRDYLLIHMKVHRKKDQSSASARGKKKNKGTSMSTSPTRCGTDVGNEPPLESLVQMDDVEVDVIASVVDV